MGVVVFCFCCSRSEFELGGACLDLFGSRSTLVGSRAEFLPEMLFVEVLLILLASKGILDFLLVKNGVSIGESLGDSYALGIAGTGGTSSSSLLPAEL